MKIYQFFTKPDINGKYYTGIAVGESYEDAISHIKNFDVVDENTKFIEIKSSGAILMNSHLISYK